MKRGCFGVDRLHHPRVASFSAKEAYNHILGIDLPRKELIIDGAKRDTSNRDDF